MIETEQQTIDKAIKKALANGWQPRNYKNFGLDTEDVIAFDVSKYGLKKVTFFNDDIIRFSIPVYEIIFNHTFAIAVFGHGWTKKLQRMVLADDQIKYLADNL